MVKTIISSIFIRVYMLIFFINSPSFVKEPEFVKDPSWKRIISQEEIDWNLEKGKQDIEMFLSMDPEGLEEERKNKPKLPDIIFPVVWETKEPFRVLPIFLNPEYVAKENECWYGFSKIYGRILNILWGEAAVNNVQVVRYKLHLFWYFTFLFFCHFVFFSFIHYIFEPLFFWNGFDPNRISHKIFIDCLWDNWIQQKGDGIYDVLQKRIDIYYDKFVLKQFRRSVQAGGRNLVMYPLFCRGVYYDYLLRSIDESMSVYKMSEKDKYIMKKLILRIDENFKNNEVRWLKRYNNLGLKPGFTDPLVANPAALFDSVFRYANYYSYSIVDRCDKTKLELMNEKGVTSRFSDGKIIYYPFSKINWWKNQDFNIEETPFLSDRSLHEKFNLDNNVVGLSPINFYKHVNNVVDSNHKFDLVGNNCPNIIEYIKDFHYIKNYPMSSIFFKFVNRDYFFECLNKISLIKVRERQPLKQVPEILYKLYYPALLWDDVKLRLRWLIPLRLFITTEPYNGGYWLLNFYVPRKNYDDFFLNIDYASKDWRGVHNFTRYVYKKVPLLYQGKACDYVPIPNLYKEI